MKTPILAGTVLFSLCVSSLAVMSARADEATDKIFAQIAPDSVKIPEVSGPEIWKDPSQPVDARVRDLLSRMTLAEKVSLFHADAPAIPRLGIPAYSYRNEAAHGAVEASAPSTEFPQSIGMAATWDSSLIQEAGDVVSTEGRAVYNDYRSKHNGDSWTHDGITFYAPNINIFRDPRWGRGQETYGEDPFLTSRMGVAFIRGIQGDDPNYLKALACAKHYDVHSGPEPGRAHANVAPPERDLYETYLVAFEAAVRDGHVGSVMSSYNALYGIPNCANPFLLRQVLRDRWGFEGYVVSDGGAIYNLWSQHKYVPTPEEACAAAIKGGCDLFSANIVGGGGRRERTPGGDFHALAVMVKDQLLTEKQIDDALSWTLRARFRLGMFDPPSRVPWSGLTIADDDTPAHRALALKVAEEAIVLLKNDGLLPLDRAKIKSIAVIGENADSAPMLMGNYAGKPSSSVTILEGIKQAAGPEVQVTYEPGCPLAIANDGSNEPTHDMTAKAIAAANASDVVIFVSGIDADLERESHTVPYRGFLGGDRTRIELPEVQETLLKAIYATGKPVVLVNCSGSAMAIPWEAGHVPAIVQAWYPGEEGGRAVAEVLFGTVDPSGKLPITFYRSTGDLPPFTDYSMHNRTYRYFEGTPVYAFGRGLSYTTFGYSDAGATLDADGTVKLSFTVKNTGGRDGDEVAQVYFRHLHSAVSQAKEALCGFARVHLAQGESTTVAIDVPERRFRYWDAAGKAYVVDAGDYELMIGGASDDIRLRVPLTIATSPDAASVQ